MVCHNTGLRVSGLVALQAMLVMVVDLKLGKMLSIIQGYHDHAVIKKNAIGVEACLCINCWRID
ncbi:hypothetical protein BDZ94DRAFT_1275059 [Collybia nuda]|uniref:Uncharacterized protein n=1 Tax=Collybia nuda TaxID=64659 RepID=A0A9P5XTR2_9AGAR|nr:hypothetical protein BDZ94DRAFT_1275059 [Collybia nuda]